MALIQAEARETLLEDLIDLPLPFVGEAWGAPDLGPQFRAPVHSELPVLFISGTLDGRTPISNAEEVAAGFPNSHHLIVDGMAHGTPDIPALRAATIDFYLGRFPSIERAAISFSFEPAASAGA